MKTIAAILLLSCCAFGQDKAAVSRKCLERRSGQDQNMSTMAQQTWREART